MLLTLLFRDTIMSEIGPRLIPRFSFYPGHLPLGTRGEQDDACVVLVRSRARHLDKFYLPTHWIFHHHRDCLRSDIALRRSWESGYIIGQITRLYTNRALCARTHKFCTKKVHVQYVRTCHYE